MIRDMNDKLTAILSGFTGGINRMLIPRDSLYMRGGILLLGLVVLLEPLFILEARRAESKGGGEEEQADSMRVPPARNSIPKQRLDRAAEMKFLGPKTATLEDDTLSSDNWKRVRRLLARHDSIHVKLNPAQEFYLGMKRIIKQTGAHGSVEADTIHVR